MDHAVLPIEADDGTIKTALKDANIPALMAATVHLTGSADILHGPITPITAPLSDSDDGLEEDQREVLRAQAFEAIRAYRDRGCTLPPLPDQNVVQEMITFLTGLPVPEGYMPVLEEELAIDGLDRRTVEIKGAVPEGKKEAFRVVIIGAGMSGILAAIRLQQAGIPFVIVDKNSRIGGTWWENTYPGCRVDSPNHLYTYIFERNDDWPAYFSTRETLFEYFEHCVEKYGLRPFIKLNTQVDRAVFDESANRWNVNLTGPQGTEALTASAVISAVGQLNTPKLPDIPGRDCFKGVSFHSARWEHEHDLTGKRVAVLGTGASATQFVPIVAENAAHLTVFQRSAPWLLPTPDYHTPVPEGQRWLFKHLPYYAQWYRMWLFRRDAADGALPFLFADKDWNDRQLSVGQANDMLRTELIAYIKEQLADRPDLIEKSIPDYPPGGKRPLRDCGVWLDALKRENATLITNPITAITETGIVTADGTEHSVDVIIYGTGFQADQFLWPMQFVGRGGRKLSDEWAEAPRAFKGITVPDFPNLFMLYGPNTNIVVGSSIIFFSECEMRYIMGCLKLLLEGDHTAMAPKRAVHDAYNAFIDAGNQETAWGAPGVRSWYKNAVGHVTQNWPGTHLGFWEITRAPDPEDFEFL
ncbi:MAG: NAD(P)-binding domain-containing protein [Alphaproteobacteria bacterium]